MAGEPAEKPHEDARREAVHEGVTMTFYVCIVLAAEFAALRNHVTEAAVALGAIWGTTVGLALAHVFAFTLAAHLLRPDGIGRSEQVVIVGQVTAALAVALSCTIPFIFLEPERARDVAAFAVAAFIGVAAFLTARNSGADRLRSALFGATTLLIAAAVVAVKVNLSH